MSRFLYENHRGSPTLTLLNVFGVLGVLNALHVLNVLYVLHMLNMLMDASLACWALFCFRTAFFFREFFGKVNDSITKIDYTVKENR